MATSSTLIANPTGTVLSVAPSNTVQITPQELAGAAAGQRPDLLAFPDRIFQLTTDPTKFYTVTGGALVLLPASPALAAGALSTTFTAPATGGVISTNPNLPGEASLLFSNGLEYAIQGELSGNYGAVLPTASLTTLSTISTFATTIGTVAARSFVTTSALGRIKRVNYTSASVIAGSVVSVSGRSTIAQVFGMSTGTLGGFYATLRWANTDNNQPTGAYGGVAVQGDLTSADPTTKLNHIGVYQIASDPTQLYLCYGGSVAQTPIPLGTAFDPRPTTGVGIPFEANFINLPAQPNKVYYRVKRLDTGAVVAGSVTSATPGVALPAPDTGVHCSAYRNTGATGGFSVSLDFLGMTWVAF